jgi:hypothetical protein
VRIDSALVTPGSSDPLVVAGALLPPPTDPATTDVDSIVASLQVRVVFAWLHFSNSNL